MRHELRLYRADQVRALDQLAIEGSGLSGEMLMMRAGECIWRSIQAMWPERRSISVCCGGGNNGGDGWVVARLAHQAGYKVQVITSHDPETLAHEAAWAFHAYRSTDQAPMWALAVSKPAIEGEVVVDALLGIGFRGVLSDTLSKLIDSINASGRPTVAVDVPSGLVADTGMAPGACVRADVTLSFVAQKCGLFTGHARRYTGQLIFSDLSVGSDIEQALTPEAWCLTAEALKEIPRRLPDAHKGDCGSVAIVGGAVGMQGAPILSGLAALHAGSGLVTVLGQPGIVEGALAASPALMARALEDEGLLPAILKHQDVIALGPGLGQSDWALALIHQALKLDAKWVLDADALNLLARHRLKPSRAGAQWIMTPHPAEAARLLEIDVDTLQHDRFEAARQLAKTYRAVVVLKGFGTLIADPADGPIWACTHGTPAMASAGMGDALNGVIASLWGQGLEASMAARLGVLIHALAGELAANGRRQITAPDLIQHLSAVMDVSP